MRTVFTDVSLECEVVLNERPLGPGVYEWLDVRTNLKLEVWVPSHSGTCQVLYQQGQQKPRLASPCPALLVAGSLVRNVDSYERGHERTYSHARSELQARNVLGSTRWVTMFDGKCNGSSVLYRDRSPGGEANDTHGLLQIASSQNTYVARDPASELSMGGSRNLIKTYCRFRHPSCATMTGLDRCARPAGGLWLAY